MHFLRLGDVRISAALIVLALLTLGAGGASGDILPHRASYALSLAPGAGVSGAGNMTFEIRNVCDGWTVEMKAELGLVGEDGRVHRLGWNQVTWEAEDATRYRYFMRESSDGEETGRRRGEARRESPDVPAKVTADLPRREEFDLPAGIMFPIQHTEALISAHEQGSRFLSANLFDGAVENEAVEVGAALGSAEQGWTGSGKLMPDLAKLPSFSVDLAYFFSESLEGLPDTEQQLRLFVNGVVGQLVFSLGDLEILARMQDFDEIAIEGC